MEEEIEDKLDGITGSSDGDDKELISFASPQNTKIKSVQFVLRTSAIEIPEEVAPIEEAPPEIGLWQKVRALFQLQTSCSAKNAPRHLKIVPKQPC